MPERKKTPDIMGSLLSTGRPTPEAAPDPEQDTSMPASQHDGKTVSQHAGKPARQPDSEPASQQDSKLAKRQASKPAPPEDADKLKATYYLSPEALDGLEEAWLQLRRMAGKEGRQRISKSAIVEAALLLAVEDLKAQAERSHLATVLSAPR